MIRVPVARLRELDGLTVESAVRVTGTVVGNPVGGNPVGGNPVVSLGGLELVPERLTVANRAATPLPIGDSTGPEGRLDWRFLDVRWRSPPGRSASTATTCWSARPPSRG